MQVDHVQELLQDWIDFHLDVPTWLHHYTTADGVLGIVRGRSMFGTHYKFLNDSLEILWGKQIISRHIDEYIQAAEEPVRVTLQRFQNLHIEKYYDVYVACFCAKDNLLSQWRAYGRSGGYALAFRGLDLHESQGPERSLRRVIYDSSEQDRWVRLVLDWFVDRLAAAGLIEDTAQAHIEREQAVNLAWSTLCEMCVSFKLDVFEEEAEWRIVELVQKKQGLSDVENVRFGAKAGTLIPYRVFPMERKGPPSIHPLDHITCGPTLSREDVEQSLLMFLRAEGCSGVWVNSSMIPLKAGID